MAESVKQKLESLIRELKMPVSIIDLFFYCDLLKSRLQFGNWSYVVLIPDTEKYTINVVVYDLFPEIKSHQYVLRFGSSAKAEECESESNCNIPLPLVVANHRTGINNEMRTELIKLKLCNTRGDAGYFLHVHGIKNSDYNTDKWKAFVAGLTEWVNLGRLRVKWHDTRSSYQCLVRSGFYNNNNMEEQK